MILAAAIMTLIVAGCRKGGDAAGQKSQNVPVVRVERVAEKSLTRYIALTGSVEAARVARIASPAEGPVLQCSIREGDRVAADQVVLTLGRKQAAEEMAAAARKKLAREQEDLERIEQLVRSGAIAAELQEEAELRVARARAELSRALETMQDFQIRAPWGGIVSRVFVADGDFVAPRETLVELFDPQSLVVRFAVPESECKNVHIGMKAAATLDAFGDRVFQAEIVRLYPELDRKVHTRTVEAALAEEIDIVPGMFVRLTLPVQVAENAVAVPDQAVVITPQGESVVYLVRDGRAFRQPVAVGIEGEQRVQITQGVHAGDSVVVSGNERLRDNVEIRVLANQSDEKTIK